MPDISMCKDKNCPAKDYCYRYTALPSLMQSYFLLTFNYHSTIAIKIKGYTPIVVTKGCENFTANDRVLNVLLTERKKSVPLPRTKLTASGIRGR